MPRQGGGTNLFLTSCNSQWWTWKLGLNFAPTRKSETFDEVSAWNETGGDSLTFSESYLMGSQRGLRLAATLGQSESLRKWRKLREGPTASESPRESDC